MTNCTAYLFAYFTGESTADGEQIYFAVSSAKIPLSFTPLAGGQPILCSTVGSRGVRDPFLIRNELQGGFHLIATDLNIHHTPDWERAERRGSRSILVWDSPDLVSWQEPRLMEVAPPEVGCVWAPEAFLLPERKEYAVFWSSTLFSNRDNERSWPEHLRTMVSFTRDFRTFSESEVYLDLGHSVIDTTFLEHNDRTYRFIKDERSRSIEPVHGKHIYQEVSDDGLLHGSFRTIAKGIGSSYLDMGEGPIAVNDLSGDASYLLIDEFGGRGYVAFKSDDPARGEWTPVTDAVLPPGARHGSLLPITEDERQALFNLV
ncbi:glycoside hydrolase family 43 protein [Arthrobacter sp. D2-10]